MSRPNTPIVISAHNNEAFDSRVVRTEGEDACWVWTGRTEEYSRAVMYQANVDNVGKGKTVKAYRYSYVRYVGEIPEGWTIDHLCNNPNCTKPEHLDPCPWAENESRKWERKTHCKYGHEYKPENRIYYEATNSSICKDCMRAYGRKYSKGVSFREALLWVEANPLGYKVDWKNAPRCRGCNYKLIRSGKRKADERRHKKQGFCDTCAAKSERGYQPPKPTSCTFTSCSLKVMSKGLCNTHYHQQLRGEELRAFNPRKQKA